MEKSFRHRCLFTVILAYKVILRTKNRTNTLNQIKKDRPRRTFAVEKIRSYGHKVLNILRWLLKVSGIQVRKFLSTRSNFFNKSFMYAQIGVHTFLVYTEGFAIGTVRRKRCRGTKKKPVWGGLWGLKIRKAEGEGLKPTISDTDF